MKTNKNGVKLLAAVMVFAMAFAGAIVLVDSEDSYAASGDVAQVGNQGYESIQDAIDSIGEGSEDKTVKLLNDTTVEAAITFGVDGITLDGNGKTITAVASDDFNGTWVGGHQGENYVLNITKNVIIQNLTVDCDKKAWGINVSTDPESEVAVKLENVECNNAVCAGFVLGHADVTATNLTVNNAVWGGINVDRDATLSIDNLDGVGSIYTESDCVIGFTDENYVAPYEIIVGDWKAYTDDASYVSKIIVENENAAVTVNINVEKGRFTLDSGVEITSLTVKSEENEVNIAKMTVGSDGLTIARGSIVLTGSITSTDAGSAMSGTEDVIFRDVTVTGDDDVELNGNITFEGTVSIPKATIGSLADITIAEGANVNVPAILTSDSVSYADGAIVKINNLDYIIYNKVLGTSMGYNVKFTIGIAIKNPVYDGSPVNLEDVSPEVILLDTTILEDGASEGTVTSNARFDASLTKFVGEAPVDVNDPANPYEVKVAVELNYSSENCGNVSNYFYPVALFNIVSPEADITLDMDGWNVNIGYDPVDNAPHFEYKLDNYEFTDADQTPFDVEYFLKGVDGTLTPQSEWNNLPRGTYTLVAEFSSWNDGNYAACTETKEIVLTAGTVASEMTFDEIEYDYVYGKPVDRLQNGIIVTTSGNTVTITGTVYYLQSYIGFWGEADDKPGYYVTIDAQALRLNDNSTVVIAGEETKTLVGTAYDGYLVLYLGEDSTALTNTFTIKYDVDGEGTLYTETTYTLSMSGLNASQYVYKLILADEKNATKEIELDFGSDLFVTTIDNETYLKLPNTAGSANWITETGKEYAPGTLVDVTDDLDVNDDGKIVFTANYTVEAPVVTDIIVDAQTEYTVGDSFVANVYAIYNDGSYTTLNQEGWEASMDVFDNAGDYTVVVTYGSFFKNINVVVSDVIIETPNYTVSFVNGTSVEPVSVKENDPVAEPAEPTAEGYTFQYWALNGTEYDFSTPVTQDIVLVAVFEQEQPEVVYSTDFIINIHYDVNERLVISLQSLDGGVIPAGTVTFSGSYVVMEEVLPGLILPSAYDYNGSIHFNEGETFKVITADDVDYIPGIISIEAEYVSDDSTITENANFMTFEFVAPATEE